MWRGPLAYGQATLTAIRSGTSDHKRSLAESAAGERRSHRRRRAPEYLLVNLGQLAGQCDLPVGQHLLQHGQRPLDPARRLEGDGRPLRLAKRLEEAPQLARLPRQVAAEAVAGPPEARHR